MSKIRENIPTLSKKDWFSLVLQWNEIILDFNNNFKWIEMNWMK